MSNKILLISGNFYPEPTGIGKYSGEMIEWLADNGYPCTVITTFPYYPDWKVLPEYSKSRYWFKKETRIASKQTGATITIIRCPHYIPTSPTGFKRLLSEVTISFSCYIALFFVLFGKKFTHVLTIAPPFELGLLGILYKKVRGAQFLYHIQDFQIDAAKELGMVKSSFALKLLSVVENYIINSADHISTISEGMIKKLRQKTTKEIILFPNWVDTHVFYPISNKKGLKVKYGFSEEDNIVLYSGAIGVKQGLQSMITSAKSFDGISNVKFVICGSGPYMQHLIKFKDDIQADNVVFLPLRQYSELNEFLNVADIHLVLQKSNASDLMMPSKLSTVLAVGGVAIVTASPGSGLHTTMNSCDMGFIVEPENQAALNVAIHYALTADLTQKKLNARAYAESNFSTSHVLPNYANRVLSKVGKEKNEITKETVSLS